MEDDTNIITIDTAKAFLGDSTPEGQTLIEEGITVLSNRFDAVVGYQLVSKEYEDQVVRGSGDDLLLLPARNITAVSSVKYRSSKSNWTELGSSYWEIDDIHSLGVRGYGYTWVLNALYKVTFTAGWSQENMPGDLVEAMIHELRRYISRRFDVVSENTGGQSSKGMSYRDLAPETRAVLIKYALGAI